MQTDGHARDSLQRMVRRGLSKAELVDTACALLWEGATRTYCRPEHFEDERKKNALMDMECSANGFDRKDIFKAAREKMRAPNAKCSHGVSPLADTTGSTSSEL